MYLSLIGMSGSGKSHWALKLAEAGFKRFCCDELIAEKLAPELTASDGTVRSLGEWMGFPYEPHYEAREATYLAFEIEVLGEILENLEGSRVSNDENVVVDTTGSVIYTGEETLSALRRNTTVVRMATPPEVQEQMLKKYITNQRPVLWRGHFTQNPGETNEEALARCYPGLLATREQLYERYAHVSINYYQANEPGFAVQDLLQLVHQDNVETRP
jgi:shikimate kinase